jgi:hypothetical protein
MIVGLAGQRRAGSEECVGNEVASEDKTNKPVSSRRGEPGGSRVECLALTDS